MAIHKPKLESTEVGLGLPNTTKQLGYQTKNHATLTETWNEMPNGAWHQGEITIAEPGYTWVSDWETGRPYVRVQFFNASRELVGTYVDITWPVRRVEHGFEYDDLYLDVWQVPGQQPQLLDADELEEAVAAGYVSGIDAAEAYKIADQVVQLLSTK